MARRKPTLEESQILAELVLLIYYTFADQEIDGFQIDCDTSQPDFLEIEYKGLKVKIEPKKQA